MAITPTITSLQGSVTTVASAVTAGETVYTFGTTAVVNYPTALTKTTTLGISVAVHRTAVLTSTNLTITAVLRGRIQSPFALAWTFTLEGHDYYVINLCEETLVYDLSQDKWYSWADFDTQIWHLRYGLNWTQTSDMAYQYGSNIICGDDTTGALYFLDPNKITDDSALGDGSSKPFERVTYGQVPVRGNVAQPCYGVQLSGSLGAVQDTSLTAVTLEFSDDQGATFWNAGTMNMTPGDYNQRLYWRSLGRMTQPGRLFRITDWGGLWRLDGIDIDDQDPATPQ